jgi:uncharacterized membrane protein
MKFANDTFERNNRTGKAAPLLLGMGLGALLLYAASSAQRQRLMRARPLSPLGLRPVAERLAQPVLRGSRQAALAARRHPGALTGVLAGLAATGLAVLAVKKSPQLRNSLQSVTSQDAAHVSNSIEISASPEEVFDVWCQYDNFPRFMSRVKEVHSLGGDRSHWKVKGPAGIPVEWNSVITEREQGRLLAWHSEPGGSVEHAGRVELERSPIGTRATVSMTYRPPGGRLGHVVASLFGRNPKQDLDRDLDNLKTFVERRSDRGGALSTSSAKPELRPVGELSAASAGSSLP